jgi:hypothetical protein
MSTGGRSMISRLLIATFLVTLAGFTTARADDMLDRDVQLRIPASSLGNALLEFSAQTGIKVAAADTDIAQRSTNGVSGTFPLRAALSMLLSGTGLEFTPVGATTVAIRNAPAGSDSSEVAIKMPMPPNNQELAGDSVYQFIVHHATVHYLTTGTTGNLAHWRGGRNSICPMTRGLSPEANAFVTARLRALATYAGAPVQDDPKCVNNVTIIFTNDPQKIMTGVVDWASRYFRTRYPAVQRLIQFSGNHAIEGWYFTSPADSRVLNTDPGMLRINLEPVWPRVIASSLKDTGELNTLVGAIMVVDGRKVTGYPIETIADYVSMLSLSVVQSPEHCDPLPSILDAFVSDCGTGARPTALTAGDLAFMKALYYKNTGIGPSLARNEIQDNMLRQLKDH